MADAIADYDTLIAEVKAWCARSDSTFSARMPVFVGLAEQRMYYGHGEPGDQLYSQPLRSKSMETSGTVTMTDGAGTLPDTCIDLRTITRSGDQIGLSYCPPTAWKLQNEIAVSGEKPYYYTVEGSTLKVTPSYTGDLSITYYRKYDPVGTGNKTGAMIVEHGLLYFQAVMYEAMAFQQETEIAVAYLGRYRSMVAGINRSALDVRASGGRVRSIARAIG